MKWIVPHSVASWCSKPSFALALVVWCSSALVNIVTSTRTYTGTLSPARVDFVSRAAGCTNEFNAVLRFFHMGIIPGDVAHIQTVGVPK